MKLLTQAHQNAKTSKNKQFNEYLSAILHLSPANFSNAGNTCPAASNGCKMNCLNTAGRGRFDNVQQARIRKTKMFFTQRQEFLDILVKDIKALIKKASKDNKQPVIRLNGTSDIAWENIEVIDGLNIFDIFPNVQFYDYTKRPDRIINNDYPNYHLTFSVNEINIKVAYKLLNLGYNAAIVFKDIIPNNYAFRKVINGDNHDLRFLEGYQGAIIGLKAKGKAKKDTTGFVRKVS